MANSNIEQFLIEFGFNGTKALKDIRKFFRDVDKIANKSKENFNITPSIKKTSRQYNSHVKAYEKFQKDLSKVDNRIARFEESRNMALLRREDPEKARQFSQRLRKALTEGDVRTTARINRNVSEIAQNYRRAAREAKRLGTVQRGISDSTRNMVRSFVSIFAALEATKSINQVGQDFQSMRAGMLAASGSAEQAAKDLQFVDEQAVRLGLDLRKTSKDFVKLRAVNKDLSDDDLKEIFLGVAEAGTVLGLSADDMTGSLRAVQQMMSKGQIMSEEFKGQLAERLPIAFRALEQATGKTLPELRKMMELGQLGTDVLPAFGRELRKIAMQGGALAEKIESARVAQRGFVTQLQKSQDVVFQSGFEEGISELFRSMIENLKDSEEGLEGLGKFFKLLFKIIEKGLDVIIPILNGLLALLGLLSENFSLVVASLGMMYGSKVLGGLAALRTGLLGIAGASSAVNMSVKAMALSFSALFAKIFLVSKALEELFAMTQKGVIGGFEQAIGHDLAGFSIPSKLEGTSFLDQLATSLTSPFSADLATPHVALARFFSTGLGFTGGSNEKSTVINNEIQVSTQDPMLAAEEVTRRISESAKIGVD